MGAQIGRHSNPKPKAVQRMVFSAAALLAVAGMAGCWGGGSAAQDEPVAATPMSDREFRPAPGEPRAERPEPVELDVVDPVVEEDAAEDAPAAEMSTEDLMDPAPTEPDAEPVETEQVPEQAPEQTPAPIPAPVPAEEPDDAQVEDDTRPAERAPEVIDESERAARPESQDVDAAARGAVLAEQGQYDAALAEFIRAIEENPTLVSAHVGAGEILTRQGDYAGGRRAFEEAIALDPSSFRARYGLALAYQLDNRFTDAAREYARALTIRPDDFDTNLNIATTYLALEEPGAALPHASRAVDLDPSSGPARITYASALDGVDRYEDAVIEYRQATELTELTPTLLLSYAEALGKTGRFEEMVQTLDQLNRVEPSAPSLERLGSALFRLKRFDEALAEFERSVEMDPEHFPGWNGIAVCQLNRYLWSERADREALRAARDAMQTSLRINRRQPKIVELLTRYR